MMASREILTLTADNFDAFSDAFAASELLMAVDLMAANPDIAEQTKYGYQVEVHRFLWEGREIFAAFAEDFFDGREPEDFQALIEFCETEEAARAEADAMIVQWERNWRM